MKKYLTSFSLFDKLFIVGAIIIIIVSSLLGKSDLLNIVIAICGVIYVFLIGKKQKRAYFYGMINVVLYAFVMLNKGLYFNFIYNLFYSFPILIYGYYCWSKIKVETINELTIKWKNILYVFCGFMACLMILVILFSNNKAMYLDYITSISGFIAMFLMARKYKEQWLLWNLNNLTNVILWFILLINDFANIGVFIMWVIYLINSLIGYFNWEKKKN
ncbi:MAG: nicotinamide riboside transporter PnuC [bacterium]|nr:nicotinamide riboside transporter PnuC [bacterium]